MRTRPPGPRPARDGRPSSVLLPCLFAVVCLGAPALAGAQAIEGSTWELRTDRRIGGALVRLLDDAGAGVASTMADSTGRFRLPVPAPGTYRLHAERMGYQPYESGPLDVVDATEVRTVEITLRPAPVEIRGLEVTSDQVSRRLRGALGIEPSRLRVRPVATATLREHAARGNGLPDLVRALQIPSMQVVRGADGPCYQYRNRGCLPVYVDGTRLARSTPGGLPLDMFGTVVILLPNELVAYPAGAVQLYSVGYLR